MCALSFLLVCNAMIRQQKEEERQMQSLGQYWFVMYNRGSGSGQDSATRIKLDQEHINYIINQRKIGKIITGGAFTDKTDWVGFEIYNCRTKEEVIKITEADPMITAKIFSYEIHPWITLKGAVTFE
jgi:uncharacterized protein YciI